MSTGAPLRLAFAGTPEFARVALQHIHQQGHQIVLVLTQPDRPAGRGMQLQASAVKQYAVRAGLPLAQPRSLRLDGKFAADAQQAREALLQANADLLVVVAYGLILPQWVLDAMAAPRLGCLNIHGSLLPRWRGAAPIHRAIEAGDADTGISIMQMDAGLDTGAVLQRSTLPIEADDTTATLHDKLARQGAEQIGHVLAALSQGPLVAHAQSQDGVLYAHKVARQEALIDWRADAALICRRVRAFDPFPGAVAVMQGESIKVWRAQVVPMPAAAPDLADAAQLDAPGCVVAVSPAGITVRAGQDCVLLQVLQRAGGKRLPVAEFLHGFAVRRGMQFDLPAPANPAD